MSQLLIETIKCKDGQLFNLTFHQRRFHLALKESFNIPDSPSLSDVIKIPEECKQGLYRCRVLYSTNIEKIEFVPNHYRRHSDCKKWEDHR